MARRGYRNGEWLQWDAYYTFDNMATGFKNRGFNRSIGDALTLPDASQVSEMGTFFPYDMRSKFGVKLPIPLTGTDARSSLTEMEVYTDRTDDEYDYDRVLIETGTENGTAEHLRVNFPKSYIDSVMLIGSGAPPDEFTGDTNGVSRSDFINKAWVTFRMKVEVIQGQFASDITLEVESASGVISSKWKGITARFRDNNIMAVGNAFFQEDSGVSDQSLWYRNAWLRYVKNVRFKYL